VLQPKAAVEFDQAINYVNKIKARFYCDGGTPEIQPLFAADFVSEFLSQIPSQSM